MPLSLRHSFDRDPGASPGGVKRGAASGAAPKQVATPRRLRPARYWRILVVGLILLIALCGLVTSVPGLIGAPWSQATPAINYGALATTAFETALATQASTLQTVPTALDSPSPQFPATSTTAAAAIPVNPWVAQIPEAACIPTDIPQTGTVLQVVDAVTIKVLLDGDGRVYSIRYLGLQDPAPSAGKALHERAAGRNLALTYGKHAILVRDITDADGSGRLLRYVMVDSVFVNYALVAEGLAAIHSSPPDTACDSAFATAEQQARAGALGLWAAAPGVLPLPTSP